MTTLSAWCQNCSCRYAYNSVTMEQIEPSEVSDHCSDRTCDCHGPASFLQRFTEVYVGSGELVEVSLKGIPMPIKDELLQKLTQGNVVYRYNNVWGVYEFLRADGSWEEVASSELTEHELESMDRWGYQYHDDTAAYCDQDV